MNQNNAKFDWQSKNLDYLLSAVEQVQNLLEHKPTKLLPDTANWPTPPALEQLCQIFNLSEFECQIIVLCAGMSLSPRLPSLIYAATSEQYTVPTFSLALQTFPNAVYHALNPQAALRRWQIINLEGTASPFVRPLILDETIFHHLTGQPCLDPKLRHQVKPVVLNQTTFPISHQTTATKIVASLSSPNPSIVQLVGNDAVTQVAIAALACQQIDCALLSVNINFISREDAELQDFCQRIDRQAILSRSFIMLDCTQLLETDSASEQFLLKVLDQLSIPLLIGCREPISIMRPCIVREVQKPTQEEQLQVWRTTLGDAVFGMETELNQLAYRYNFNIPTIQAICHQTLDDIYLANTEENILPLLKYNCSYLASSQLKSLAQHIKAQPNWDDLVLPSREKDVLESIISHITHDKLVRVDWGWRDHSSQSVVALFTGTSGTGKTTAAELIGKRLGFEVYRVDLATVASKYVGETEKKLRDIFDAAEQGGVLLLFDEADALFGKRGAVKDSRDRYANLQVSYLLQRLEAYRGLAILTTNLKEAIDPAFLRRIRFVVKFPFPDAAGREAIWRRVFPAQVPTEGLNYRKLAQLNAAGGTIRNIALNGTFRAAAAGEAVTMGHLLRATESEYLKLEQTLPPREVAGWLTTEMMRDRPLRTSFTLLQGEPREGDE